MKNKDFDFSRGNIYFCKLEPATHDSIQSGWRPCVIVQNNIGNIHSNLLIVLPMTTVIKKPQQPTHVIVQSIDSCMNADSMILAEQPMTISKSQVYTHRGRLSKKYIELLDDALRASLELY